MTSGRQVKLVTSLRPAEDSLRQLRLQLSFCSASPARQPERLSSLLLAGVLVHTTDEVLGWVLMGSAAVPLLHVLATWRAR